MSADAIHTIQSSSSMPLELGIGGWSSSLEHLGKNPRYAFQTAPIQPAVRVVLTKRLQAARASGQFGIGERPALVYAAHFPNESTGNNDDSHSPCGGKNGGRGSGRHSGLGNQNNKQGRGASNTNPAAPPSPPPLTKEQVVAKLEELRAEKRKIFTQIAMNMRQ